jgi:hypothetical protein
LSELDHEECIGRIALVADTLIAVVPVNWSPGPSGDVIITRGRAAGW